MRHVRSLDTDWWITLQDEVRRDPLGIRLVNDYYSPIAGSDPECHVKKPNDQANLLLPLVDAVYLAKSYR